MHVCVCVCMFVLSQSVVSHSFTTPWTVTRQVPLSMRGPQARILEWAAISFLLQGISLTYDVS